MNPAFASLPTTIFEVMSSLARDYKAINLGQGFPDDPGPEDVRQKAADAVLNGYNQYPSMMGIPELREAMAVHYQRFHGVSLDPLTETLVTSGATEALTASILATVSPGDEVVLFQPMYDSYLPIVKLAGGLPKFVNLKPPHWRFTEDDLKAVFSDKTKVVIFNNPLNPSGVVYSREDVELLGRFCEKYNALLISDEVWEHLTFDDRPHTSVLSVPSLRQRSVKIGSAGKIFSLTGWKIGLVCAAPQLLKVVAKAHQFLTFTTAPNLQVAVAYGLMKDDAYFTAMRAGYQRSRDYLSDGLAKAGLSVLKSQGTYFVNVDLLASGIKEDDVTFCQRMVREKGLAAIPVSAFYAEQPVTSVVRFCFAKTDATLDAGLACLKDGI